MLTPLYYVDAVLGILLLYLVKKAFSDRSTPSHPYPPGPRPWPLIGNIFDMPKVADPWNVFAELGKKYGPIIHFKLLGEHLVVVNSHSVATEMLDRMVYSDRPSAIMAAQLSGYEDTLPFMSYGPRVRATRRLIHRFIGTRDLVNKYAARITEEETRKMMQRILKNPQPEALREHIRKTAGGMILRLTYAYTPREDDDPFVNLAENTLAQFSVVSRPGAFLVDVVPWLRYIPPWMPGAGFLRYGMDAKRNLSALAQRPMDYVKEQLARGNEEISFMSENVKLPLSEEDEDLLKWTASNMYAGGADTGVSTMYAAFLALIIYPEVQKKAQEEIDRVVGSDRLPTIQDRDALPYIDAITKEVFRWNPTIPLGVPHRLMEDDIFNGYFIPKDTVVMANIHNMLYDEEAYPDPSRFEPERFIAAEGREVQPNPYSSVFGFGRRVCSGIQLADMSLFTGIAMCAAVLDVQKAVDATGAVIEPKLVANGGTISHPAEFKCTIKARSSKAADLAMSVPFNQ